MGAFSFYWAHQPSMPHPLLYPPSTRMSLLWMGTQLSGQRLFHACHISAVLEPGALTSFQGIRGISAQTPRAVSLLSVLSPPPFFCFQFLRAIPELHV